jgi:CRP-like cAMP-binding protein
MTSRLRDALHDAPSVLAQPPPSVVTEEFADHGVGYWGRFFIQDFSRRETIDSEVRDRIWFAFAREGISIPYPIRVNYNQDASGTRAEKDAEDCSRRRRALEKVDFLSSLPKDDMDELASLITTKLFGPGESIIRQGRAGQELYIIEHGEVAVFLEIGEASGAPREIARLHQGEYFGEMSLMTGEARSATVRAVGEVELVMVDKPAFQKIIEDNPTVLEQISEGLAKRQSELKTNAEKTHPGAANLATDSHIILKRIRRFFSIG